MADLSFNFIADEAGSGMSIGYLYSTNQNVTLIAQQQALVLWELLASMTKRKACVVVWWGQDSIHSIVDSRMVPPPDEARRNMELVFWKGFRGEEEFVLDLVAIWNNCMGIQIYPTDFGEQIPDIIASHFFDTRDKKRLGMDYSGQHRPTLNAHRGLFWNLRSAFREVWTFTRKVRDADFREELMNPFRSVRDAEVVKELGLYIRKGGDGICLELLTSSSDVCDLLLGFFGKHNIPCSFTKERRATWG